tara:strand:- start:414 stop:764 length:351 start_codon:yes stop_codon:yes gene_type:complete
LKNIFKIFISLVLIFLLPIKANTAEILQINSSNSILVGDQNRNLTIKLFCVDVNENDEQRAVSFLKKQFPRGSKVKIKPFGFEENILIAKIFNIKGTKEMSDLLISNDLTKKVCAN